ncbi:MFS transporter, putative The macrolide (Erythromycin, oleando-mycin, azithromycin) efflux, MefA [Lactobacillus kullabergensis]|uniref:MFS transporter, putative The macrolide (Erythromycin, oleando-mycin, azithromycin) efflux, MefA n=1 Tax=Lactobacillus kullabergensis TaxID=1218493 RepID=A0A0F4LJB6_9LACO|nr:MFS transporter [Lactobacillus kullabergensis]KJY58680.1 MFS transporter, putative The macrolide (Erythromycin, oleando-mycin, azithromycin) efflux, MefA [Lactobacillus kullabergensis]
MKNILKSNNNKLYLLSVITDNLGSSLMSFALPLMVLDITKNGIHLSIISIIETLPILVLGLPAGALTDKLDVKKILIFSDLIRLISYLILSASFAFQITVNCMILIIYAVSLVVSVTNTINTVSEITFVSFLVEKKDFSELNSLIYGIQYAANFALPIVGGILYQYISHSLLIVICAIFYLISLLLEKSISLKTKSTAFTGFTALKSALKTVKTDIKEGLQYTLNLRSVLYPLILAALVNIVSANFDNDSLIILRTQLKLSSQNIGIISAIAAVGALIGTFVVNWLNRHIKFNLLFVLLIFAGALFRALFALYQNVPTMVLTIAFVSIIESIINISIITNRQQQVEQKYLGRVTSIYKTVLIGVNSLGYLLGGLVAKKIGSRSGIGVSAIELLLVTAISIFLLAPEIKHDNES